MKSHGLLLQRNDNKLPQVDEELKRRSMDTPGVMDAVYGGWKKFGQSHDCYREVISSDSMYHRRSDLTDESSMKLYCSFFNDDTKLTDLDVTHMTGGKFAKDKQKQGLEAEEKTGDTSRLRTKAAILGIQIEQSTNLQRGPPALFTHDEVSNIPSGFEQINEDLFARKDNRFMVFNRVGINDVWPPTSKTKVGGIEDDMEMLQSTIT